MKNLILCLTCLAGSAITLFAQAPSGLVAKTATNKQVALNWNGNATSYAVQRAVLGETFSTIATVPAATYTDNSIDAYTSYQYQVLNGSAASTPITVGPPPSGFTVVAPASQAAPAERYGYDLTTTLDVNGDPAFAFLFYDPNGDSDASDTQLLFRSWNRAQYRWNPVVKVATVGDVASKSRYSVSLVFDPTLSTWAIASETSGGIAIYSSTDGAAWTNKRTFDVAATTSTGPSLALVSGNIYLAYIVDTQGLKYVTGKMTDAPSNWTITSQPKVSGVSMAAHDTAPSLAVDSSGSPGIAYWCGDPAQGYNQILMYWRPAASAPPVRVLDTHNKQTATAIRLRYAGLNPRLAFYAMRSDAQENSDDGNQFVRSDDAGVTWPTANIVSIPPDGTSSTNFPFDLALTSRGAAAFVFGQNSGTGDEVCGRPKVSRSTDLIHWTTCAASDLKRTSAFSVYPGAIRAEFGGNDKLYMLWWEQNENSVGEGIVMYREPAATAQTSPSASHRE